MGSNAAAPCHVVAVPYPGRGHINAILNLCRLLVAHDGSVSATVVVTEEWLGLLGAAVAADFGPRVRFETIPNVIPSEHGRAGDMVRAVSTRMTVPFERLLDRLPPPAPSAIVADVFVPWAVDVGERRSVPACVLCPISATKFVVHYNFHRLPPAAASGGASPVIDAADGTDPSLIGNYIPGLKSIKLSDLGPALANEKMLKRILEAYTFVRRAQCVLFTSFHEFEGDAIDVGRQDLHCPAYAVGPCIPFMALQQHTAINPNEEAYMAWLDSQPARSVLYVSLGSFLSVSATQLDEIAAGLAESKARILWTVHDAGRADGVIGREEIATAVGRLMSLDTAEAEEMRRRAKLLKDAAHATVEVGGSSWSDLTSFIKFISQ
ncbi:hypothetical protein EJB05_36186, partial [Eragrostis curvula]